MLKECQIRSVPAVFLVFGVFGSAEHKEETMLRELLIRFALSILPLLLLPALILLVDSLRRKRSRRAPEPPL